jgi:F-type H+-transporting ATPase subunit b
VDIIPKGPVLIVQIGGFLLVLLVFKLFLFKPILGILDARRREIESEYERAEADRKAAEDLKAQYDQHLASVQDEMRAKITDAVKQGQAMRDEIIADSRAKADSMVAKAEEEIRREKDKALVELRTTVADLAVNAAGKLIDENLNSAKHRDLVSKYIDQLDEVSKEARN